MSKECVGLVLAYFRHEITIEQFLEQYPVDPRKEKEHVHELLQYANANRGSRDLEAVLFVGHFFGLSRTVFSRSCVPLLNALLAEDWHINHDEIVFILQELRDPRSIEALYQAAFLRLEYMEYDDTYGIAANCCWALGDINTASADEKLRELATSENPIIADYAREQLERDDRPPKQ